MPITYAMYKAVMRLQHFFRTSRSCEPRHGTPCTAPEHQLGQQVTRWLLMDGTEDRCLVHQENKAAHLNSHGTFQTLHILHVFKKPTFISGKEAPATIATVSQRLQINRNCNYTVHRPNTTVKSPLNHKSVSFKQRMSQNVTLLLLSFIFLQLGM